MVRWPEQPLQPEQRAYLAGFADMLWFLYAADPVLSAQWIRGRKDATTGTTGLR